MGGVELIMIILLLKLQRQRILLLNVISFVYCSQVGGGEWIVRIIIITNICIEEELLNYCNYRRRRIIAEENNKNRGNVLFNKCLTS